MFCQMLTKSEKKISPVIVARLSWRYIYWITAGVGVFVWGLLVAFVPETRYFRSDAELGMFSSLSALENLQFPAMGPCVTIFFKY